MNNRERRAFTRVSLMYLAFIAIVAVMCALALAVTPAGADGCIVSQPGMVGLDEKVYLPFIGGNHTATEPPPLCEDYND